MFVLRISLTDCRVGKFVPSNMYRPCDESRGSATSNRFKSLLYDSLCAMRLCVAEASLRCAFTACVGLLAQNSIDRGSVLLQDVLLF